MKTLVVGLGNPILGDDGVGWKAAELVQQHLQGSSTDVEVDYLAVGGISLMERLIDYDRAILIDAIQTGVKPVGSVICARLEDLPDRSSGHMTAIHDTSLPTALKLGRSMGARLPETILVVGIEAQNVCEFSEALTPPVAAALPQAVEQVFKIIASTPPEGPEE
jgi:hydrogenase maturation protease